MNNWEWYNDAIKFYGAIFLENYPNKYCGKIMAWLLNQRDKHYRFEDNF